jgi:thymidylate synthase (FAD)
MGSDAAIVEAARVSYQQGTKAVRDDEALIRYLVRNAHTTPLEMVVFKFHVKAPIFVARQWMRHRMATYNEVSGRYSVMGEDIFIPPYGFREQGQGANKQASGQGLDAEDQAKAMRLYKQATGLCLSNYKKMIALGVSREMARMLMPLSSFTEFYFKTDLHNLLHFLRLRMDSHAQPEIQAYADVIAGIVQQKTPIAYKAWQEYHKAAPRLTEAVGRALAQSKTVGEFMDAVEALTLSKSEREEIYSNFLHLFQKAK